MINFPGRKLISYYIPRTQKEFLYRTVTWVSKVRKDLPEGV